MSYQSTPYSFPKKPDTKKYKVKKDRCMDTEQQHPCMNEIFERPLLYEVSIDSLALAEILNTFYNPVGIASPRSGRYGGNLENWYLCFQN